MARHERLICDSAALVDGGKGVRFALAAHPGEERGFAVRHGGKVCAFVNRCPHAWTELDWQPGEFLDSGREFILCSIHGAAYAPQTGQCLGGPCGRGRLLRIDAFERDGAVWWQPTRDTRPAPVSTPELQGSPSP